MTWDEEALSRPRVDEFFKVVSEMPPVEGLKVGVYGPTGSGKTHFALTAPKPVFVIDTEFGCRLVAEKFPEKDQIYIFEALHLDPKTLEVDPVRSLELVEQALTAVIGYVQDHPDVRGTIVIDSMTDIWSWLGIWLDESPDTKKKDGHILRFEWGKANKRYIMMIHKLLRSKWHVVLTGKIQEVFDSEGRPVQGMYRPRWQRDTEYWVDIVMRSEVRYLPGKTEPLRQFTITKCRAWNLTGTLANPTWDDLVRFIEEKAKVKVV